MKTVDFLVVGGGVMGITIAKELKRKYPDASVLLIEKESKVALHASGRNSGVIHAGFYYSADSLKARFTRDGNRLLHEYCEEKNLAINKCGKLVVCNDESELEGLKELNARGKINGVNLEYISQKQAKEIEPRVKTFEQALWSPDTSSVNPVEVMQSLEKDALEAGVEMMFNTPYLSRVTRGNKHIEGAVIKTNDGEIEAGYLVNTAGLYADKIAQEFNFSSNYRILPFKGLYLYADKNAYKPRVHIYPVPDIEYPFLGVHFTLNVDGHAKIGPTAIPAFWRENYEGLDNFNAKELFEILSREAKMWLFNHFNFRTLAWKEMQKYQKSYMIAAAQKMLEGTEEMGFTRWGRPGIRAQLVDIKQNRLEMDFIYEGDRESFHLLNAVSPAFTCSLSIAKFVTDKIADYVA